MDAHRRIHRRQAYSGNPFQTSPTGGTTKVDKPASTSTQSPSTSTNKGPTSTTSSTPSTTSSTSSSTSSTSSTSSSSSVRTTATPVVATPTPSTTLVQSTPRTSLPSTSFTRTSVISISSSPSSTGSSGDSSNSGTTVSTGAVIGGIAAALLGIAGIIFAILYFIRRLKKRKDDYAFDSDVFKRQSRMLPDEPQMVPDDRSPFAPRPPSMIERRMNSTPVSNMSGNNYGPGPAYGGYNEYNAGYGHPGFAPGQVISHHQPYADSRIPPSPMSPPMSPPMSVNHSDVGAEQSQSAYLSRQPSTNGLAPVNNGAHYVDLSRSSVTPFQAAQYEEIHRRLNMPPPEPVLGSLAEEEYPPKEPLPKGPSPFADPSEDVLPPPSPVHSNRSRVDSTPPKLPELNPPMSPVYALHPAPIEALTRQTETPAADLPAAPAPAHVVRPNPSAPNQKRPDTVYTIYDDEDAYGGI